MIKKHFYYFNIKIQEAAVHRKTPVLESLFNKVAALRPSTPRQDFSSEFCETIKDTVFTEHLRITASEIRRVFFLRISCCFFGEICFDEHNSQNFLIICLKEQGICFATICVESLVYCIS